MPVDPAHSNEPHIPEVVLITDATGALPIPLMTALLGGDSHTSVVVLHEREAGPIAELSLLRERFGERLRVFKGRPEAMDLGLAGSDFRWLTEAVTTIHHVGSVAPSETGIREEDQILARATGILEAARESKRLRRLLHWSSTTVAGKRKGVVLEEELDVGQPFHNHVERGFMRAEKAMRAAMPDLPITVARVSCVIGDSTTGEMHHFEGAGRLMKTVAESRSQFPIPLPSGGRAPLHIVPVDYAVNAAIALSHDERAAGRTFHLTDICPLPARFAFELVAKHAHTKVAKHTLPSGIARTLLRAPGVERLSRSSLSLVDTFDQLIFFNCRGAVQLLEHTDISCPTFDRYVGEICSYLVRGSQTAP